MRINFFFQLFFLSSIVGFGQGFSISGKVVDSQGSPVSFANVVLMTPQDSTIVKGVSTDDKGLFNLKGIENKTYILKISFIGYTDILKTLAVVEDLNLGAIGLTEEAQTLDEVSIVFKKPTIKKEADRLVFNVENTALIEGNMLQVLKSTPGVLVINDAIMVKNTSPEVYINNRKVNLSASEVSQLLESSSASTIKSIEVITNPSARYDASGGAVINIIMSKNLISGYNGSVFTNYTQGVFPRYNFGTSHFFKSEKINFYSNYNYTQNKLNRYDLEDINYFDGNDNISEYWKSNTNRNKWTQTHNLNFNIDYILNPNNTLYLSSNMLYMPYFKYKKTNFTNVFDMMENLDFYFDSNNLERDKKHNLAYDLGFLHQFSKGNLSINTHFTDYNYNQDQAIVSNYYDSDGTFLETTAFNQQNEQNTKILAAQGDYSLPLENASTFETGIKASHIETNSMTLRNDIVNGQEILNPDNTDDFDYRENIQAAYVNYSKDSEKWNLSLGLRVEQTNIRSESVSNNEINNQDYFEWFPTTSISHDVTDKWKLYTNYKRSIQRPDYQNLNPFRFYYNDNNLLVGNPNLKPLIEDHVVVGTTLFDLFSFEAYYKSHRNKIVVLPRQDNTTNILMFTPLNLDTTIDYGFDFEVSFYPIKDWSFYFLTSFYNIKDKTVFGTSTVNQNKWSNYSIVQNDFTFLDDRSLNLNFTVYFVGSYLYGFRVIDDRWVSSLSVSKSIMNKKAIISLSVENIFNAQDYNYLTRYLNQFNFIHTNVDERYIRIGFRYNFGNTNLKSASRTKNLDERKRLKESN